MGSELKGLIYCYNQHHIFFMLFLSFQVAIDMPDILSIDEEKRIVRVEPMVSIGQLNDFLIQRGWTLPVVPELDDLTIGGQWLDHD